MLKCVSEMFHCTILSYATFTQFMQENSFQIHASLKPVAYRAGSWGVQTPPEPEKIVVEKWWYFRRLYF